MNILVFAHDSSMYGASRSLLTALIGLSKRDYNILVLLPYGGRIEEYFKKESIEYKVVPFPRCVIGNKKTISWLRKMKAFYSYQKKVDDVMYDLNKIIESFKPDIIYTNTSVVSVGYHISKKNHIPHVWHVREFGDLDYDFTYLPNRKKIIKDISKSKEVVFGSESLLNHWLKNKRANTSIIYNGILKDDKLIYNDKQVPLPGALIRFGVVGAITKGKGQYLAIEAFAKIQKEFPSTVLCIYGEIMDQDYFEYISELIQKFDLTDKVTFKGFIIAKDEIYNNIDILLSCSKMEGFGRTIVEAMGYGIPVIANASGGVVEIIEDNVNGLLFDGTVEELVSAVSKLTDADLFASLSKNGFNYAKNKYSIERYVSQIDDVLRKAINN